MRQMRFRSRLGLIGRCLLPTAYCLLFACSAREDTAKAGAPDKAACQKDGDCVVSCRDECCSGCSCDTVVSASYAEWSGRTFDARCDPEVRGRCPMLDCAKPEYKTVPRCQQGRCAGERVPLAEPPAPQPASAPASVAASTTGSTAVKLSENIGKEVTLTGRISKIPWQHMMGGVPGKSSQYFDLEDGNQIVIYITGELKCPDRIELTGVVVEVSGPGKGSKAEETYREWQLDVSRWRCL
jgi:hypothetical protein